MKRFAIAFVTFTTLAAPVWAADDIAVDRVILSSSGLANFVHRATVTGNAQVAFPVRFEQVDDILKSLIIFDRKGRLGGVTLPGRQPLDQLFKDLPFTRQQIESPMLLLNAYQGAVVTLKNKPVQITGRLVSVVPETAREKDTTVTQHRISVLTDSGLKQAVLENVDSIQFDDKKIRDEISRALDAIREYAAQERRMLSVNLNGEGSRDVTLSYVVDSPLWKTAYRMVVPESGQGEGLLQGWAVIENMTASDWKNIDLTLVSGNPVTFRQSLYTSYYVDRPEIPVQVFGRVMPRVDQGAVAMEGKAASSVEGRGMNKMLQRNDAAEMGAMADYAAAPQMGLTESSLALGGYGGVQNVAGAASVAQSAEATSQVLFRFPDRLSLKAGQSMMVPFVSKQVPMTRVSLYQPETHPTHPLAAIEVKNEGEVSLPAGVLTLYEESDLLKGAAFVGDAQLPMLAAGEKRLVSYALDGKITIDRSDTSQSTQGKMSISKGVLRQSTKTVMKTTYAITAPKKEKRVLILEHPKVGGYNLVTPDPKTVEETPTHYRIRYELNGGDVQKQEVVVENEGWQSYQILDMSSDQIAYYLSADGQLDANARAAFEKIAKARAELDAIQVQINTLTGERQTIFDDQARLRQNLESLSGKSDLQKKYMDKLNQQEDRLADIDDKIKDLNKSLSQAQEKLKNVIEGISF